MLLKKLSEFVWPEDTYASHVQSRLLNLPSTPAMIWNTSFEVFVVTGPPRKSSTRNSVHALFGTGLPACVREASNVCNAAGIGRLSCGIGADQTVMAGG